jgi:RNA-directed DNA polymerase
MGFTATARFHSNDRRPKYKRLRRHAGRARRFIADVSRRQPGLFAHWRFGVRPDGWTMGAR